MRLVTSSILPEEYTNSNIDNPGPRYRPQENYRLARKLTKHFNKIVPNATEAIASCRFQIMGKYAHDHNGPSLRQKNDYRSNCSNRWCKTEMQTFGQNPFRRFKNDCNEWIRADSFDGANEILAHFGLTMDQVLNHFGNVNDYERKTLDLVEIIAKMKPKMLN